MAAQLLVLLAASLALSQAYPTGAPDGACASLNPDSHGPSTATGSPPYTITFSSSTYAPSQFITVTLAGQGSAQFKGFLVEGRKADGSSTEPMGTFVNPAAGSKLACNTTNRGITHTNNTVKSVEIFTWQAPSVSAGDIIFQYTVVRGGAPSTQVDPADYFMNVKSSAISPAGSPLTFEQINAEVEIVDSGDKMEYTEEDVEEILRLKNLLRKRRFE